MQVETVEIKSQPMLCVTRSASMASEEISAVMQEAFTAIGAFIGRTGITPATPPLAVYHDRYFSKRGGGIARPLKRKPVLSARLAPINVGHAAS